MGKSSGQPDLGSSAWCHLQHKQTFDRVFSLKVCRLIHGMLCRLIVAYLHDLTGMEYLNLQALTRYGEGNGLCGKMNTDEINARTPGISCDKGHLRFLYTTSYGTSVHYLWKSDLEVDRKVMPTGAGVGAAG